MQTFTIPGRLPGYNELTSGHWTRQRQIKAFGMVAVKAYARQADIQPVEGHATVRIYCYEPNSRRDYDNVISGASKCVLDALKHAGIIKDDSPKYVTPVWGTPQIDKDNPRVVVELEEVE